MPKNEGGWREKQSCSRTVEPQDSPPKLSDLGISKSQSSRFQAVAAAAKTYLKKPEIAGKIHGIS